MRPRHDDRFVLIGLCWLYGRSEYPPPPPDARGRNTSRWPLMTYASVTRNRSCIWLSGNCRHFIVSNLTFQKFASASNSQSVKIKQEQHKCFALSPRLLGATFPCGYTCSQGSGRPDVINQGISRSSTRLKMIMTHKSQQLHNIIVFEVFIDFIVNELAMNGMRFSLLQLKSSCCGAPVLSHSHLVTSFYELHDTLADLVKYHSNDC